MTEPCEQVASPFRINMEQQSDEAIRLQGQAEAGSCGAAARIRQVFPDYQQREAIPLVDAQIVIASELGFGDWSQLAAHVARMDEARRSIEAGAPAPDTELSTLHIRCGSDLQQTLPAAGFAGDILEFSDAACQGPLKPDARYTETRAAFLYNAYLRYFPENTQAKTHDERLAEIQHNLDTQQTNLASAADRYRRVVLWFEHDSFDQVLLVQILAHFARHGAPETLEMVTLDHFPGTARFIGLGQLPPEALRVLWPRRMAVGAEQLALGQRAWNALCCRDPNAIAALLRAPATGALPYLPGALHRHLQELPAASDGLSLTQRLVLEQLHKGDRSVGDLFRDLIREREPLPWLGDTMLLHILRDMARLTPPVFTGWSDLELPGWPEERLTLADTGRSVLLGDTDWMDLAPPVRWLGGVRLDPQECHWRWHEESQTATARGKGNAQ